ncbi:MAG: hypothetical protein KC420_05490 [Myxococcales bacterium]|nr:hypothetical protein [Myxococcales bacterium]
MKHQIHADLVHLARPIGEVRINPANTNTHPEEQLERRRRRLGSCGG